MLLLCVGDQIACGVRRQDANLFDRHPERVHFHFIGGLLDYDEHAGAWEEPVFCVLRELIEETNLRLEDGNDGGKLLCKIATSLCEYPPCGAWYRAAGSPERSPLYTYVHFFSAQISPADFESLLLSEASDFPGHPWKAGAHELLHWGLRDAQLVLDGLVAWREAYGNAASRAFELRRSMN